MKKIKILAVFVFACSMANAQSSTTTTAVQTKGDPLVNGIPYSQYKAQQNALKQQQEQPAVNNAANTPKGLTATNGTSERPAAVVPQKMVNVQGTSFDQSAALAPAAKTVDKKNTEPAVNSINTGIITKTEKAPIVSDTNAVTEKTIVGQPATNAATSLALPAGLKLETAPAAEKVTPVEQKVTPGTTDTPTKTKTN